MEILSSSNESLLEDIRKRREETERREVEKSFSPPGALGLPPLLDAKRVKYGIPDSAWRAQAVFNKILVWQVPIEESNSYGSGLILKTERKLSKELNEAPRGIIVSAGLQALDELRSNGVDIGHTVFFTHLAPYRKYLPAIGGREPSLVILHSGDVFDSEELADSLRTRRCRVIAKEIDGQTVHLFCDENGKTWSPSQNVAAEDG